MQENEPTTATANGGEGLATSQKVPGPDGETDDLSDDPKYRAELAALSGKDACAKGVHLEQAA